MTPGLVLFDERQRVEAVTSAAERLLADVIDDAPSGSRTSRVPYVVHAVASRAMLADGSPEGEAIARAPVQTRSGRWLSERPHRGQS
jgi:hypothetical protein